MKSKSVNIKQIAEIAPDLGVIQLIQIFELFGLKPVFSIVKRKGNKK